LDTWKVLEYVFLKNDLWMFHDESIFRKESTSDWPARVNRTFLSTKEAAWFLQLQRNLADPRFVFMNRIKPNFDISPEKLRCPLTGDQRESDKIHQADGDMEVGLLTTHSFARVRAREG